MRLPCMAWSCRRNEVHHLPFLACSWSSAPRGSRPDAFFCPIRKRPSGSSADEMLARPCPPRETSSRGERLACSGRVSELAFRHEDSTPLVTPFVPATSHQLPPTVPGAIALYHDDYQRCSGTLHGSCCWPAPVRPAGLCLSHSGSR
jgi:hypothetical protein